MEDEKCFSYFYLVHQKTHLFLKEVDGSPEPPNIFVIPNPVNFNNIDALDEDTMTVHVSNLGDDLLDISLIYLEGDNEFSLDNNESVLLEKGEQSQFDVKFNPLEYDNYFGNIIIKSNNFEEEVTLFL